MKNTVTDFLVSLILNFQPADFDTLRSKLDLDFVLLQRSDLDPVKMHQIQQLLPKMCSTDINFKRMNLPPFLC
jgi:hypothetical protein